MPSCIGMFWPHGLQLIIADPEYLQELFTTHHKVFTKHFYTKTVFSDMIKRCLLFAQNDEPTYKQRRKLVSHAFTEKKVQERMSKTIFEVIEQRLLEWLTVYQDRELDLVSELVKIQGRIVVSCSIGASYADRELPFLDYDTGATTSLAIGNFISKLLNMALARDSQILFFLFPELLKYSLTPYDRCYVHN